MRQIITNVSVTDTEDFCDCCHFLPYYSKQKLLLQQLKDNVILKMLHKSYFAKQLLFQPF